MKRVGVLALQGDFNAHMRAAADAGISPFEIRTKKDLQKADFIILPGGESTVMIRLLKRFDLWDYLRHRIQEGVPTFATCAGFILVATKVLNPAQDSLGLINATLARNAYGSQSHSFSCQLHTSIPNIPQIFALFIRAPKIIQLGTDVEVLAQFERSPVLVRQGSLIASCFHSELQNSSLLHRWFFGIFMRGYQ